jgi:hypothetical protein
MRGEHTTSSPTIAQAQQPGELQRRNVEPSDKDAMTKPMDRIANIAFGAVYQMYLTKIEKKGRTKKELNQVIEWLTGFDSKTLRALIQEQVTLKTFFEKASLNPNARLITGVICGYRVEKIKDPLMKKIRYLDKLVDELANGKPMEKILRAP